VKFIVLKVGCDLRIDFCACEEVDPSVKCREERLLWVLWFDLVPRIKLWCRVVSLESIDCHSYRHLL
jgi:hypothetical protein